MTSYFDDVNDHIDKVIDRLEESRKTIGIYKDTYFLRETHIVYRDARDFTLIFTPSIPITIIGSLYGMNVEVPALEDQALICLGTYATFVVIVIATRRRARLMQCSSRNALFSKDQVNLVVARIKRYEYSNYSSRKYRTIKIIKKERP